MVLTLARYCQFMLSDFFFFFKQKTAYEMRISDWSSDVCSSDLSRDDRADGARPRTGARGRGELDASARAHRHLALYPHPADGRADDRALSRRAGGSVADRRVHLFATCALERPAQRRTEAAPRTLLAGSDKRRVRKECVSKCRSRGAPDT